MVCSLRESLQAGCLTTRNQTLPRSMAGTGFINIIVFVLLNITGRMSGKASNVENAGSVISIRCPRAAALGVICQESG